MRPNRTYLQTFWKALTVPRSLKRNGAPAGLRRGAGPGRRSGIALVVVMTTIMIVTVIVTELSYTARVRFMVDAHHTERQQAYWLAHSGIEIYNLLILADRQVGDAIDQLFSGGGSGTGSSGGLAINGLLDMVPQISTGLLTMFTAFQADSDVADMSQQDKDKLTQTGQVSDEVRQKAVAEGGGLFSERSWLDMPGDFTASVKREDCLIDVNLLRNTDSTNLEQSPTYQLLLGRMSGDENEQWLRDHNLTARDLIANLADWVDADGVRSGNRGGYEDALYQDQDPPYHAKNAAFDSKEEIRLVEGWQDDVYDRFANQFTVFGGDKVNISCGDDQITWAILHSSFVKNPPRSDSQTQEDIDLINEQRMLGMAKKPKDFVNFLNQIGLQADPGLVNILTDNTSVYRVTSTGMVGNTAVTITDVLRFDARGRSTLLYHRVD